MDRNTRTVLIVDGSATTLHYHGILLQRLKYTVVTTSMPEDALKIMEQMVPSLVLTALSFSGMSGIDFIRRIKGSERTRAVPVLVLSAEESAETKDACLGMGAAAYLIKPVDPANLYRAIQMATESRPRSNIRIGTKLKVVLEEGGWGSSNAERTEYATTISEGGLYLRTQSPKPKNAQTPVRIFIGDREIRVMAEVLYSFTIDDGMFSEPGMAIKFTEISDDDRNFVRGFIKSKLTSDIDPLEGSAGSRKKPSS